MRRPTSNRCRSKSQDGLATSLLAAVTLILAAAVHTAGGEAAQQSTTLSPALEEVFEKGVEEEKVGRLDEAERAFLQVLRDGGRVAFVYNNLGTVYQQRGEQARAAAEFRQAIRLDANYVAPRILLGASLLALGQLREATRELDTAVKLAPREKLARLELAKAYERQRNPTGMIEQYGVLRELAPQDPEFAYQLGSAYLKLSTGCVQQILELDPRSARAFEVRGEIYRERGDRERAVKAFSRALEIDSGFPGIHLMLAEMDLEQGKTQEARKELEQELAAVPDSAVALALKRKIDATGP